MGKKPILPIASDDKSKNSTSVINVFEQDDRLWTTSLDVAEKFRREHRTVLRAIKRLECSDYFRRHHLVQSSYQNEQGKDQPMILLSRSGFSMIAMGFTGRAAVEWKEKFIAAFDLMEKTVIEQAKMLKRQGQLAWQTQRQEGKAVRRIETDAIKEFVEYARGQGSKNAHFYYSNITSMGYNNLFLMEKGLEKHFPKKLREYLDIKQIINLSAAELAVEKALRDGMDQGLPYKEIFLFAKTRVETLVSVMGKTRVLPIAQQPQVPLR